MRSVSQDSHDEHRYDDLLKLEHPVSRNHRQMPRLDRAAQFMPFAALTGYEDSIEEASRRPEVKIELSDTQQEELNARIQLLAQQVKMRPWVVIRYYYIETEKEHVKITAKADHETTVTSKRKRIEALERDEAVRKKAKGRIETMGYYCTIRRQLKRIDGTGQTMTFTDGTRICFADIVSVDSECLDASQSE